MVSMMPVETDCVQLAFAVLVGKLIETIPHTAVEVFGLEWFYGGGIQSLPSREVVQVYGFEPVEVLVLGLTTKTKTDLLRFLEVSSDRSAFPPPRPFHVVLRGTAAVAL